MGTQLLDLSSGLSERIYGPRKRTLLGALKGDVLEIGPGTGASLDYFSRDVRWTGVEPNVHARAKLVKRAAARGIEAQVRLGVAEHLEVDDQSADAVVATLVLCSVDDVSASLREILRVLRPGGRFLFIEHVAAAQGTRLRRFQDVVAPLWRACADGCNPNRETGRLIEEAGFDSTTYDELRISSPMVHLAPHIAGTAIKRADGA